jgi:hypothetical protein
MSVLSKLELVYTLIYYFFKKHFIIIIHLCLDLQSDILTSGFPNKFLYAFLISLMSEIHVLSISFFNLFEFILLIRISDRYSNAASTS